MEIQSIISIIMGLLGIGGVIFTVYNSFKDPQIKSEKEQIKVGEDLKDKATILSQKEVENKAEVLAKQFQWEREANDKKFCDFGKRLDDAFLLAANHINTVDMKVDKLVQSVNVMNNEITRLSTIVEERMPKKI